MSKNALDRSVLDIITDTECGTPEDKLRLFLVYYICSPNMTDVPLLATTFKSLKYWVINWYIVQAETDQYASALQTAGCNLSALRYLKRWKWVIIAMKLALTHELITNFPCIF